MSRSLYDPTGHRSAPNNERESVAPIQKSEMRDRLWYEALTNEQYQHYHREAWSEAYLFLGHVQEAEEIADAAIEELYRLRKTLSESQIEAHLRRLAQWRAIDRLRSPQYRRWKQCLPLWGTTKDGEEYEVVSEQLLVDGAEEEFLQQLEATEHKEVTERRLAQLHQAILHIKDGERRACFVLRHTHDMKPAAIAKRLGIPVPKVYAHLRLAMAQVTSFMQKQERKDAKRQKKGKKPFP